jgi:hypothetical protein
VEEHTSSKKLAINNDDVMFTMRFTQQPSWFNRLMYRLLLGIKIDLW